jgi:hypothetical protein
MDFYHKLWLLLKAKYPRLRKRMDDLEASLILPPDKQNADPDNKKPPHIV